MDLDGYAERARRAVCCVLCIEDDRGVRGLHLVCWGKSSSRGEHFVKAGLKVGLLTLCNGFARAVVDECKPETADNGVHCQDKSQLDHLPPFHAFTFLGFTNPNLRGRILSR